MSVPRRVREQRSIYARVPDNNIRVNSPDGFLVDFDPIGTPNDASDIDGLTGAWWYAQGDAPYSNTKGSPLTERGNQGHRPVPLSDVLPAITRCLTILTESVVRTRWIYRNPRGEAFSRPLWITDPMLIGGSPGPIFPLSPYGNRLTGHGFWSTLLADAILWGQGGFVYIEAADRTPLPGTLLMLNPMMFRVGDDGHVLLDPYGPKPLRTDFDGRFQLNGQTWRVATLSGQTPNHPGWPQGVLLKHWRTFRVGARLSGYLDNSFMTGVPSGYLSVSTPNFGVEVEDPDNPGEMIGEEKLLKRSWMRAHGKGKRSVAVLNSTVTYTPIAMTVVDADAVKMASVNRTDIAHAFGMSSVWLDEGMSGLAYSNASERRADFVSMTAAGWGEKITNLIQSLMPFGTEVQVNWMSFVSPSPETLMPALVQAVQTGLMTAVEARQMLGFQQWMGPDPAFNDNSPAARPMTTSAKEIADIIQSVYLGVGKVLTADEARGIANAAGAGLDPTREVPPASWLPNTGGTP